ncbi:FGGY-family carbohydrate kinase [Paracoccus onubensis]|uniref:FGGY-family carbohydrate kinase n=1 Tax=Paracoccus onubensis TaxID=1675788 RepID=UPI002731D820|nr:FGGY-family carbohydrate kinase [Paracoccus onubensis]MDP0929500.1 FGGY-family carbohydrate kinase [Paracoccus onubensis]
MEARTPIIVGIDIGTTNVKAVSIDADARVLSVHRRPMVIHSSSADASEFDLSNLVQMLIALLSDTAADLEAGGYDLRRIAVLSVAAIGESFVGLDRDDRPALPCPTWYDRRTGPYRADTGMDAASWFDTTGMVDDDIYTIWRQIWWRRHQPDVVGRVARWFSVSDYALFCLGGAHVAHPALAARTGLADRHRLDWSDDHLAIAGVRRAAMPELLPQASVAGHLSADMARLTGLPQGLPLVNAGHDHPCAGLGAGMTRPGTFVNSAGTAESLIALVDHPLSYEEVGDGEYDCYPHAVSGQFLLSGHIPTSGAAIDWIARQFGLADDQIVAGVPPGCRGVRVAPYLQGSGSPWNRRDARLRMAGIDAGTSKAELTRATYEGLAAWLSISVTRFEEQTGYCPQEILLTGGGGRHRAYTRIKAAILNRTLVAADIPEAAGIGAAMIGGLAIGIWHSFEDLTSCDRGQVSKIRPDPQMQTAYFGLKGEMQDFLAP